jgi:hypothetical protein
MTRKEQILRMIERLPEDVSYERVMYHLDVMHNVELGMEDIKNGRFVDHDELFDELLKEYEKTPNRLERKGQAKPAPSQGVHRRKRGSENRGSCAPARLTTTGHPSPA